MRILEIKIQILPRLAISGFLTYVNEVGYPPLIIQLYDCVVWLLQTETQAARSLLNPNLRDVLVPTLNPNLGRVVQTSLIDITHVKATDYRSSANMSNFPGVQINGSRWNVKWLKYIKE